MEQDTENIVLEDIAGFGEVAEAIHKYGVHLEVQRTEFDFPTNQLDIEESNRFKRLPKDLSFHPSYLRICYDEYIRNFLSMSIGSAHELRHPLKYDPIVNLRYPELDSYQFPSGSRIAHKKPERAPFMHHFQPTFNNFEYKFRSTRPDTSHFLNNIPNSDINIMMKVDGKKDLNEPLFASFGLFWITEKESIRVSEMFRCDLCNNEKVRRKFNDLYFFINESNRHEMNRAQIDPITMLKSCMFHLPTSGIDKKDVYLVCFVHKVLTGENHCSPYVRSSYGGLTNSDNKLEEAARRLKLYRQQLGFGALRLFDENLSSEGKKASSMHLYATRTHLNDSLIGAYVREMYFDKTNKCSLDILELDLKLYLYNYGGWNQMQVLLNSRTQWIVPSQFCSASGSALTESWDGLPITNEMIRAGGVIRRVAYLPPKELESGSNAVLGLSLRRQLRMGVDNTIFVYPNMMDRFKNRNICIKVEFLEFHSRVIGYPEVGQSFDVLCNLYNTIQGPLFVTALFTTVWYHNKAPMSVDEFKIRLPNVVTDRHFIRFTALQINVNRDKGTNRQSLLGRIGLYGAGDTEQELDTAIVVGVAYLPLQDRSVASSSDYTNDGDSAVLPLLPDKEHMLTFSLPKDLTSPTELSEEEKRRSRSRKSTAQPSGDAGLAPILKVSTRCFSSFASTCEKVHKVLTKPPVPLGQLTKSDSSVLMNYQEFANEYTFDEETIAKNINDLRFAFPMEMNNHFLVLMRIVVRAMCGGNGIFSETNCNPFSLTTLRCSAFLAMLQLFSRLCPEPGSAPLSSDTGINYTLNETERKHDKNVLQAFVDHIFDEEIPLTVSKQRPASESLTASASAIAAAAATSSPGSASASNHAAAATTDKLIKAAPWAAKMSSLAKEAADVVRGRHNVYAVYSTTQSGSAVDGDLGSAGMVDRSQNSSFGGLEEEAESAQDAASEINEGVSDAASSEERVDSAAVAALNLVTESVDDDKGSDFASEDFSLSSKVNKSGGGVSMALESSIDRIVLPRTSSEKLTATASRDEGGDDEEDEGIEYEIGSPSVETPHEIQISARRSSGTSFRARSDTSAVAVSIDFNDISFGPCDNDAARSALVDSSEYDISHMTDSFDRSLEDSALVDVAVEGADNGGLDDEQNETCEVQMSSEAFQAYEAYVAEHWTLEVEKLIVELQIHIAVTAIVESLDQSTKERFDSFGLVGVFESFNRQQSSSRWFSDTLTYATGSSVSNSPFDAEAFWFQACDASSHSTTPAVAGSYVDAAALFFTKPVPLYSSIEGFNQRRPSLMAAALAAEETANNQIALENAEQELLLQQQQQQQQQQDVASSISAQRLNSGASISSEASASSNPTTMESTKKLFLRKTSTPVHVHWWPWAYEVITFQWLTVLKIFHGKLDESAYPTKIYSHQKYVFVDSRTILVDKSIVLLRMILKSLIARVVRDKKRSPVALDQQYFHTLLEFITEFIAESFLAKSSERGKLMIQWLSEFVSVLLGIVIPAQMQLIVWNAISQLDAGSSDKDERMLVFIEELCRFEYFVSVNMPLTPDLPWHLVGNYLNPFHSASSDPASSALFSTLGCLLDGINIVPRPHWLVDAVVQACMKIRKRPLEADSNRKTLTSASAPNGNALTALELLTKLLTKIAYDERYQPAACRQRLALMFWPLFYALLDEIGSLSFKSIESNERKQVLAIMLSIMQDTSNDIIRDQLRRLATDAAPFSSSMLLPASYSHTAQATSGSGDQPTRRPSRVNSSAAILTSNSQRTSSASSIGSGSSEAAAGSGASTRMWHFIHFLHLCLETFSITGVNSVGSANTSVSAGITSTSSSANLQAPRRHSDNIASQGLMMIEKNKARAASSAGGGPQSDDASDGIRNHKKVQSHWIPLEQGGDTKSPLLCAFNSTYASSALVLRLLQLIAEECPKVLYPIAGRAGISSPGNPQAVPASFETYEGLLQSVMAVMLHALSVPQEQECCAHLFALARALLANLGAKLFVRSVGDTLQDWIRVTMRAMSTAAVLDEGQYVQSSGTQSTTCSAVSTCATLTSLSDIFADVGVGHSNFSPAPGVASEERELSEIAFNAASFLLTLLKAQYIYCGSFVAISDVLFAVVDDFIESKLNWFNGTPHSFDDEEHLLLPFMKCLHILRNQSQQSISYSTNVAFNAFHHSIVSLVENIEILVTAHESMRRYVSNHVVYDWQGTSVLDDMSPRTMALRGELNSKHQLASNALSTFQVSRKDSTLLQQPPLSGNPKATKSSLSYSVDVYELMETLYRAALVFDPIRLPRQRIFWLENLAVLQSLRSNRVEGGEIRWQIYQVCLAVKSTWQRQWAPRQPLEFGSSRSPFPTFLAALSSSLTQPIGRPWASVAQHSQHMKACLAASYDRFIPDMPFLAERSSKQLLELYRVENRIDAIHSQLLKMQASFKLESTETGSSNRLAHSSGGLYYWVHITGNGAQAKLKKDFIYRFNRPESGTDFPTSLGNTLKSHLPVGSSIRIVTNSLPKAEDQSSDIVVFVIPVAPLPCAPSTSSLSSIRDRKFDFDFEDGFNKYQTQSFRYLTRRSQLPENAKENIPMESDYVDTITLRVRERFPFCCMRQVVCDKETKRLAPIEVITEDFEQKCILLKSVLMDKSADCVTKIKDLLDSAIMPKSTASNPALVAKAFLRRDARANKGLTSCRFSGELSPLQMLSEPASNESQPSIASLPISLSSTATPHVAPGATATTQQPQTNGSACLSPVMVFNGNSSTYQMSLDAKLVEQKRRLQVCLFEYLLSLKSLLGKSRKLFITDAGLDDVNNAAVAALTHDASSASNASLVANNRTKSASIGASIPSSNVSALNGSMARKDSAITPTPLTDQHIINWQVELERQYDTLLENTVDLLDAIDLEALRSLVRAAARQH